MATPSSLDAWRHALSPWLDALRYDLEIMVPNMPTREQLEDLWILFQADEFEPARWTLIMEALELLDLLVRVDADVGWSVLFSVTVIEPSVAIHIAALFRRHKVLPRYCWDSEISSIRGDHVESVFLALRRMIGEDDEPHEPPSSDFPRVKQLLLDAWSRTHGGRTFDRNTEGRITFKLCMVPTTNFRGHPVPHITYQSLLLARASRTLLPVDQQIRFPGAADRRSARSEQPQLRRRCRRAAFCFVEFEFKLYEHSVTSDDLCDIMEIARTALPITALGLGRVQMSRIQHSFSDGFITQLLGVRSAKALKRFKFACRDDVEHATVVAVCSALALSRSLEEFTFTSSRSGRDGDGSRLTESLNPSEWWPWLAYALFSMNAQNKIRRVKLAVRALTLANVEAMRAVLQHPNPLAYVSALDEPTPKSPVLKTAPSAAILKSEAKVTIGHRVATANLENAVDRSSAHITSNIPYQIVRDNADEGYLEVVLPGSGVGWVDRTDVEATLTPPCREAHSVSNLELKRVSQDSQPAVLALLGLVGGSIETLEFKSALAPLDDSFMTAVCTLCPRLKSLRIGGVLQSLNWLLSPSPGAKRLHCRLKRLERLEVLESLSTVESLVPLLQTLQHDDHELTRSLRELHLNLWGSRHSKASIDELSDAWLAMLCRNSRLERCEFLPSDQAFEARVRVHNGGRIFAPATVAFLSVLVDPRRLPAGAKRHKADGATYCARHRLAREAIDHILELADVPLRRICV